MKSEIKYFVGVDVQVRGCCFYIIDKDRKFVKSGWIRKNVPSFLRNLLIELCKGDKQTVAVGIDAPRAPMRKLRKRVFDKKTISWIHQSKGKEGRECEVIIKSYGLGNPQWTRRLKDAPEWMRLGFSIYNALKDFPFVYEVFPTASYKMLQDESVKYELCLNGFSLGVKDMLDASVCAITVFEFINGKGCEVGGGDELGTIVLPRKI